ncbi:MAG: arginine--tRNA ligase, partial [Natronosporangium sp.]
MTPDRLSQEVLSAARDLFADRGLDPAGLPAAAPLERPRNREHGDYASTIALQLAKRVGVAPRELASALA